MVAGTHSGVGKTTIATGLMAAFRHAGLRVRSAKVGPDFIDPGFHSLATGAAARNLDAWICGPEAIAPLAGRAASGGDLLIVEGVMGLFDGAVDGSSSSTADIARLIGAPVVLVVDGSAMSSSVAAMVRGYRDHEADLDVAGVILNRVTGDHHRQLLTEALAAIDVTVLGTLQRDDRLTWRHRHLGLVPVEEQRAEVIAGIAQLGAVVAAGCDLEHIRAIANGAQGQSAETPPLPEPVATIPGAAPLTIAVAGGAAFTFLYRDNLEALEAAGAELISFDPLTDPSLPDGVSGVVIGGGFPEVFGPRLADNRPLMDEVGRAVAAGLPTWAECGGLLWLAQALDGAPMIGALEATATMTTKLTLGYRRAEVRNPNPLAPVGTELRGHEFHYSSIEPGGEALTLSSRFHTRSEGFARPSLLATYLHQHLGADPAPAASFVQHCAQYQPG